MSPQVVVALALLVLGVALGVVGNWLKPPAKMGGRAIVAIFTGLLILAAGITYFSTSTTAANNGPDRASDDVSVGAGPSTN